MADITREDVATIIQEEYASDLLAAASTTSAAIQLFRHVDMGTKVKNLPVLATLPEAEFVTESADPEDEDGTKPTSKATWGNKQLVAEEIAVIIPVHENVIDDATEDVLDEIVKEGGAAIGRKLDGAVFFSVSKPATWTSLALYQAAMAANQDVPIGSVEDGRDLGGAIYEAAALVDEAGWDPDVLAAPRGLRFRLPNVRDADGRPIWTPGANGQLDNVAGLDTAFVPGLVWNRNQAEAIVADHNRVIIGIRQDITVKLLTEATVGGINLAEKDMVALRFKARYAYVLGSTRTTEGANKVPVAVVTPATGS